MSLLPLLVPSPVPDPAPTTPTPTPTPGIPPGSVLSMADAKSILWLLTGAVLAMGVILLANRWRSQDDSLVRSWLALSFAFGLLAFTLVALTLQDENLRSTLVGALAASVGAAVTHYFASRANQQARNDLLTAAAGPEQVPHLIGLGPAAVMRTMSSTSLRLRQIPEEPGDDLVVKKQDPLPNATVPRGTTVEVTFEARRADGT